MSGFPFEGLPRNLYILCRNAFAAYSGERPFPTHALSQANTDQGYCDSVSRSAPDDERVVHQHEEPAFDTRDITLHNQSCVAYLHSVHSARGTLNIVYKEWRNASMPRVKQASKKRVIKTVPVLGAAGLTFSMIGGAS